MDEEWSTSGLEAQVGGSPVPLRSHSTEQLSILANVGMCFLPGFEPFKIILMFCRVTLSASAIDADVIPLAFKPLRNLAAVVFTRPFYKVAVSLQLG